MIVFRELPFNIRSHFFRIGGAPEISKSGVTDDNIKQSADDGLPWQIYAVHIFSA